MAQYIVDGTLLSNIFDVSSSTIRAWREQGMPCIDAGGRGHASQYNAPACIRWYVGRQCGDDNPLDLNLERARLAHHQANKTAVEESVLKGEVVRTLDVIETWVAMIGAARAKLLTIPTKLASQLHEQSTEAKKAKIDAEIRAALAELSGTGLPRKIAALMEAGGAGLASATKAKRQ